MGHDVNPLRRSHPAIHLPLAILGVVFALPFVWLLSTSLQPREQAMRVPPQWLPRLHVAILPEDLRGADGAASVTVVPPEPVSAFAGRIHEKREALAQLPAAQGHDPARWSREALAQRLGMTVEDLALVEAGQLRLRGGHRRIACGLVADLERSTFDRLATELGLDAPTLLALDPSAIGRRLGERRVALASRRRHAPADFTVAALARRVGLTAEHLTAIEAGAATPPDPTTITRLAEELWLDPTPLLQEAEERLFIRYEEAPATGKVALIRHSELVDGKVPFQQRQAEKTIVLQVPVTVLRTVPANWVVTRRWRVSKYATTGDRAGDQDAAQRKREEDRQIERDTYHLPRNAVTTEIRPVLENYPEAVRALTADPDNKTRPLGALLLSSRMPWHGRHSQRPITFLTYLTNTLAVTLLGVIGTVLSSSLVAYGLARIRWRGRKVLFGITLATMMVPFPVIMVPLFAVFRELGWIGTLLPLWVPAWFGSAFNIFLLRQFFLTLPEELSEAARIDGASELRIWWSIALPLARPALAVVALFHFLYAWNDFLGPLIYLTKPETFTLALGLQQYQSQSGGSEWHLLMAASVLMVVPIIVLFFFTQKTFIRGIATTGMKG